MAVQLFVKPIVGLADNGDFSRVMKPVGLTYLTDRPEERYWFWSLKKFGVDGAPEMQAETPLSEFLLAKTAAGLDRLRAPRGPFDIRALGAIHLALLLAFLALVAAACRDLDVVPRWIALALAVFFFTDVGYVAPFNSLYGQVASLLFFLLAAGIAAVGIRRGRLDGAALVAYFACAVLFVVSKPQECLHGPILAALGLRLARVPGRRIGREPAAWLGIALCAVAFWSYSVIPRRAIREVGLYHTVFMELLRTSPDPAADLAAMRLDADLARHVGVNAYAPEAPLAVPAFRAAFFDRFGYADVLRFYATHPRRFLDRLRRAGRQSFALRPVNLGNFDQASGLPAGARSRHFGAWSEARALLGHGGFFWIVGLLGVNLAAAVRAGAKSRRLLGAGVLALCTMAALEFGVCSMADYLDDVSRHLYVFQAMWRPPADHRRGVVGPDSGRPAARAGGEREPGGVKSRGGSPGTEHIRPPRRSEGRQTRQLPGVSRQRARRAPSRPPTSPCSSSSR